MQTIHSKSRLFKFLPWYTGVIRGDAVADDNQLQTLAKALLDNEFDLNSKHPTYHVIRAILMTEDSDHQSLDTAHPKDMTKAMSRILPYRLLDIRQWLKQTVWTPPISPVVSEVTAQTFLGAHLLSVLGLQQLKDWTSVIDTALHNIAHIPIARPTNAILGPSSTQYPDVTGHQRRLFEHALAHDASSHISSVCSNLNMAAAYLALYHEGYMDPHAYPNFDAMIKKSIKGKQSDTVDRYSRVQTPLMYAVVVSPIALLENKILWKDVQCNRKHAFESLICFSRNKPAIIHSVERSIWRCILDMSLGKKDAITALREALHEIDTIIKDHPDPFPLWFSETTAHPPLSASQETILRTNANPLSIPSQEQEPVIQATNPSSSLSPLASEPENDDQPSGAGQPSTSPRRSRRPRKPPTKTTPEALPKRNTAKTKLSESRKGKQRSRDTKAGSSNIDADGDVIMGQPDTNPIPLSLVDLIDLNKSEGQYIDATTVVKFTSLTSPPPPALPPIPTLSTPLNAQRHIATRCIKFGQEPYTPAFHHQFDIDAFLDIYDFLSPLSAQAQFNILNNLKPGPYAFARSTLEDLFGRPQKIKLIDYRRIPHNPNDRFVMGTYLDLLRSEAFGDKGAILATRQLPCSPSNFGPPPQVSTDVHCWDRVLDRPYCLRHDEFPEVELRWTSAGTRGSFGEWHVTTHGLQTYITPLVGEHWVVIAQPNNSGADDIHPFQSNLPKFTSACAVKVQPGQTLVIQPGAVYRVFYLQAGVTAGGSCYNMEQFVWSCRSFFISFARGDTFAYPQRTKAVFSLLRRIVVYIHRVIVLREDIRDVDPAHTPHIRSPRHLSAIIAILCLVELAHVVHPDTYQPGRVDPVERHAMIHTRLLARQICHHLNQKITITKPSGTRLDFDEWFLALLKLRSRHIWNEVSLPGCSRDALRYQLQAVLPDNCDWDEPGPLDECDTLPEGSVIRLQKTRKLTPYPGTGETRDDVQWRTSTP